MADTDTPTPTEEKDTVAQEPTAKTDAATAAPAAIPAKKRKAKRSVPAGQVHILASFNNTIVSFTDPSGGVLTWASAGGSGFRGSKKGTAYAAQVAAEQAGQAAKQLHGFSRADVYIRGIGLGRDAAVRSLQNLDIKVESLHDVTGIPHGGVRPRKARRV